MFGVKRWCRIEVDSLEAKLELLKSSVACRESFIEERLRRLECAHKGANVFIGEDGAGRRACANCGKTLERYKNYDSFDAARIAYEQARLDEDKKRLKGRQKKAK